MRRPEDCPDILFNLMSECWNNMPDDRPTFLQICQRLLPEANENFKDVSFYMCPDGIEAVINQEAMFQVKPQSKNSQYKNKGSLYQLEKQRVIPLGTGELPDQCI